MKVCIFATPRSSSTNLYITINNLHKFNSHFLEPFHPDLNDNINNLKYQIENTDNIIVKLLHNDYILPPNIKTRDEYKNWITNNFTHVICLYRGDTTAQAESLCHRLTLDKFQWQTKEYLDLQKINKDDVVYFKGGLDFLSDDLKNFSMINNYFIVKYEDLILNEGNNETFKNLCNYLDIEFDPEIIYSLYKKENEITIRINKN